MTMVARLLSKETRRTGTSFKEAVNHYLRLGLMAAKTACAQTI